MTRIGDDVRGVLVDAAAVFAIAVVLVAVHVLVPPGVRERFVLAYADPNPFHGFTAAYVHLSDAHLVGNLGGLLAGGAWAVFVSHLAGERRWFRFSLLWFLTGLPIAVGLTGAALIGLPLTTRGFSGVVAGFAGFGLVGVGVVLHRGLGVDRLLARDAVALVAVVVAAEIVWLVSGGLSARVGGFLLAAFGLTLVPFGRAGYRDGLPTDRDGWVRVVGTVVMVVLLGAFVAVFVVKLFPTTIVREGSVTNVFGHYLGLVYGAVIAGWGYRYWSVDGGSNRRS